MLVAGHSAAELRWLILFIAIVCAAVWALVVAVLIIALGRRRVERTDGAADPQREHGMSMMVSAAVAGTVFIIAGFTIVSFAATRALDLDDREAIVVDVKGHQWWWEISYGGLDPDRPLVTANEIHVPVGKTIKLRLSASDVIHSFWVPSLAGKKDLIPGRDNTLTFRAERAGVYRGQCAEFCGFQHAHMAMLVIAETPEAFESWRMAQLKEAAPAGSEEEARGHDVFVTKACAACHTVRGTSAAGKLGPDLTHVASRRMIAAGLFETTRGTLAAWTADPQNLKPGNNMPMVALNADELKAVSAYMAGLQ